MTINERQDVNTPMIVFPQNTNEFVHIVEEFTYYQKKINKYRTTLQVYFKANVMKIDRSWEPNSNRQAGISLVGVWMKMFVRYNRKATLK